MDITAADWKLIGLVVGTLAFWGVLAVIVRRLPQDHLPAHYRGQAVVIQSALALVDKVSGKLQGKDLPVVSHREPLQLAKLAHLTAPVVVDGGANKGDWTAGAMKAWPDGRFILFEPGTSNRATLAERFGDNVSVSPMALSDRAGSAELYADFDGSGIASLYQRRLDHHNLTHTRQETVNMTTLDAFCQTHGIDRVDVLKLDIEGHELAALQGAENILKTTRLVQFEFGGCNIDSRTFFQDFWYFFTERGFALYRMTPFGPSEINRYSEREECFLTTNYAAAR